MRSGTVAIRSGEQESHRTLASASRRRSLRCTILRMKRKILWFAYLVASQYLRMKARENRGDGVRSVAMADGLDNVALLLEARASVTLGESGILFPPTDAPAH